MAKPSHVPPQASKTPIKQIANARRSCENISDCNIVRWVSAPPQPTLRLLSASEIQTALNRASNGMPSFLATRFAEGARFNRVNQPWYPYNEVTIRNAEGTFRVDSYNPDTEEIISRKFSQLSGIRPGTAKRYLNELARKYQSGSTITDSRFNPAGLRGTTMQGQLILEVPVQNRPIDASVLRHAEQLKIWIRDVEGRRY